MSNLFIVDGEGYVMIKILNGYLVNPEKKQEGYANITINDEGIVVEIEEISELGSMEVKENDEIRIIDATGCNVVPGLVDVHVHFRDPGFTHKEDIMTGAKSAAAGGFTDVVLMANTKPAVDNEDTLNYILDKCKKTDINVYTCATITEDLKGKKLVDIEKFHKMGAIGFTDDGIPIMDENILREAMKITSKLGAPISLHEEDVTLIGENGINSDIAQRHFGLKGAPREAEITLVKRDMQIAIEEKAILNIQHISTKEAVDIVRQAKNNGYDFIHAEATPHHFSITQEMLVEKGTLAKMNPPVRMEEDRIAIINGLVDGTIDMIATDHAPHSDEEKNVEITKAPSGIIGLETSLSLSITKLLKEGYLTISQIVEKMSVNPAKLYGLDAGVIDIGRKADITIFNENETRVVDSSLSKSNNTPFLGEKLYGVVHYTICNGSIVYENK